MRKNISSLMCAYILLAIPILLVLHAGLQNLQLDRRYASVLYFGRNLGLEQNITAEMLPKYMSVAASIVTDRVCRSDVLKAGLALYLSRTGHLDSVKDYDLWLAATRDTLVYIEHAIKCLPTDGNLWLAMAITVEAVAERPERISQLVARSQELSPAEYKIIFSRLSFYNRLSALTLKMIETVVLKDIKVALQAKPKAVRSVLNTPSHALMPYILKAITESGFACSNIWIACNL